MKHKKLRFVKPLVSVLLLLAMAFGVIFPLNNYFSTTVEAADDEDAVIYDLKIYYKVYGTDTEIYPHFHAMLPSGTNYEWTSPNNIKGYSFFDESQAVISGKLDSDTEINVYYIAPQLMASYTVNYYTIDVDENDILDKVTLVKSITDKAYINEQVRVPLEVIDDYSWVISDLLLTVTEDGLATKNLYYLKTEERVIALRTGTGYAKTITAIPGTDITEKVNEILNDPPTKAGYEFIGWDNTLERTTDENGNEIIKMPEQDIVITALWEAVEETYYHVEYYFENLNSDNTLDPANYTRVAKLNTIRNGLVGTTPTPTVADRIIADQLFLLKNDPLDRNAFSELTYEEFEALKTSDELATEKARLLAYFQGVVNNNTNGISDIDRAYILETDTYPFFGFNFAFAEAMPINIGGTTVLKLYYSREDRTIQIYENPCKVGNSVVDPNPIWLEFQGKYGQSLPPDFPTYDNMENHFNGVDAEDENKEFTLWASSNSNSNSADQSVLRLFNDNTFFLLVQGKQITGTYTGDGSSSLKLTPYSETITQSFSSSTHSLTLTISGKSTTFKRSYYCGTVEQNQNNTASIVQSFRFFVTATDTLNGILRFYPKYISEEPVIFSRIIYAVPVDSMDTSDAHDGFNAITNISELPKLMEKSTSGTPKKRTTVGQSAYVGYTLDGGKYVINEESDQTYTAYNSSEWSNIESRTLPDEDDIARCFINSDTQILNLKRGTKDVYFKVLLKPVYTKLSFINGNETVNALYKDEGGTEQSVSSLTIQYTEQLKLLYKEDAEGNLIKDSSGNYVFKYYLKDPSGLYEFAGWYLDGALTEPATPDFACRQTSSGAEWSVYAKWLPKTVKVTFDCMGGHFADSTMTLQKTVNIGDEVELPENPTLAGFTFKGWYFEGHQFTGEEELGSDIVVHAVWQPEYLTSYTVEHVLKVGTEEITLSNYTYVGYGVIGSNITVKALDASAVAADDGHGYYISIEESNASKTVTLNADPEHNIFTFYYNQQTSWPYNVYYLDRSGATLHEPKTVNSTDMLYDTEAAPHIDGYAMIAGNGTLGNGTDVFGVRGKGYVSAYLKPGSTNNIYIYYDKLYNLDLDLNGAESENTGDTDYNQRQLIYMETTTIPKAPVYTDHIFLGWEYNDSGTVKLYYPGDTFTMPEHDATLTARWAHASVNAVPGRLLDRITDGTKAVSIAQNGTVTANFALIAESGAKIIPNSLRLLSDDPFPQNTVMTLIVYDSSAGQTDASYYYYKADDIVNEIYLKDFVGMGMSPKLDRSDKADGFWCQVCVEYPDSAGTDNFSLSAYTVMEQATTVNVTFSGDIVPPVGSISATGSSAEPGKLNATVTVSDIAELHADQSDKRHTHDILADYKSILTVTLKEAGGKSVPFPENSTVEVNGTPIKNSGTVEGMLTSEVSDGVYTVTASGLPTDREIFVCFSLCASDCDDLYQNTHPMRLTLASVTVEPEYSDTPEYAIRAELHGGDINRVFPVPSEDKVLTFNVTYYSTDTSLVPNVTAYAKVNGNYVEATGWDHASVETVSDGNATVRVTVPQGTSVGTYRLVFAIGDAKYNFNLIVTEST